MFLALHKFSSQCQSQQHRYWDSSSKSILFQTVILALKLKNGFETTLNFLQVLNIWTETNIDLNIEFLYFQFSLYYNQHISIY